MFREIDYASVSEIVAQAPAGMTKFRIEVDDHGVALVTIDRPDKLNAFSMGYAADQPRPGGWSLFDRYMRAVTQELKHDPAVKVIVLTGAGRAFSAGADIKDWSGMESHAADGKSPFVKDGLLFDEHTAMMHIWFKHLIKPTIAMVNGPAVGMGADLAAVCDIRMMADTAFLQWAYVLNGLVPTEGGMWLLQRLVGQGKAFEWLMTGQRIHAEEALRTGLANHVVPVNELRDRTLVLARHIATLPTSTVQATRFGLNAVASMSYQDSIGLAYLSGYAVRQDVHERVRERAAAITDADKR
ncbi:MAG: enoyl-CoA hydratase/isomerase family protein [Candidatus Sphingomonas colombiensis]|nr:enoyl-CoA hydratase/isomerase family protein [Sphingomonas sp.]WEK44763.1 MAG: enoyl-CoA hydratase/isomerase family protein [Sphingomonas sp.]